MTTPTPGRPKMTDAEKAAARERRAAARERNAHMLGPATGGQPSQRYLEHVNGPPAPYVRKPLYLADTELGPAMAVLTDRQRAFVWAKTLNGANNSEAARAAGYEGDGDSLKSTGYRLAHSPKIQSALQEEAVKLMRDHAPVMIEVLHSIAINPQNDPKARIKAASELLSRSGLGATQHIEVTHKSDVQRDPQIVAAEIIAMGRHLGLELDPQHLLGPPEPVDAEFTEVSPIPDDLSDIL